MQNFTRGGRGSSSPAFFLNEGGIADGSSELAQPKKWIYVMAYTNSYAGFKTAQSELHSVVSEISGFIASRLDGITYPIRRDILEDLNDILKFCEGICDDERITNSIMFHLKYHIPPAADEPHSLEGQIIKTLLDHSKTSSKNMMLSYAYMCIDLGNHKILQQILRHGGAPLYPTNQDPSYPLSHYCVMQGSFLCFCLMLKYKFDKEHGPIRQGKKPQTLKSLFEHLTNVSNKTWYEKTRSMNLKDRIRYLQTRLTKMHKESSTRSPLIKERVEIMWMMLDFHQTNSDEFQKFVDLHQHLMMTIDNQKPLIYPLSFERMTEMASLY